MKQRIARVGVAVLLVGGVTVALAVPSQAGQNPPITITKVVTGPEPAGASYVINVSCIGSGPFTGNNPNANLNFSAGGGSQQFGLPGGGYEGDCTITETSTSGAVHVTYACVVQQAGAATCGGGGTSPSTLNVNDPAAAQLATITVTNDFTPDPAVAVAAPPNFTG